MDTQDTITRVIDDSRDELAAALIQAHKEASDQISRKDVINAIASGSGAAIYRALGITEDGSNWPRLDDALHKALIVILAPVFDYMISTTMEAHDGTYNDAQSDRAALDSALAAAITAIVAQTVAETLAGVRQATALAMRGDYLLEHDFMNAIGLTDRQVAYYYRINKAAEALRAKLAAVTSDHERRQIADAFLSTMPVMVAAQLRKKLKRATGRFGVQEANTLAHDVPNTLRLHRFTPLADFSSSTVAHVAEDSARIVAQRLGFIPATARKYWRTMHDERVRHMHTEIEQMNADGVPLDGLFETPLGFKIRTPPAERNCRCRVTVS